MLTVITAATDRKLTTLDAVKAELEIADGADDTYLDGLILQVSAAIEKWCCRPLVADTVREVFHPVSPASPLILARYPIVNIVSVTIEGSALPADHYEADAEAGFLYRLMAAGLRCGWPLGRAVVDYVAGFPVPSGVPADLQRAATLAVRNAYVTRGRDTTVKSEDVDGVSSFSYRFVASLPSDVVELMAPYRAPTTIV